MQSVFLKRTGVKDFPIELLLTTPSSPPCIDQALNIGDLRVFTITLNCMQRGIRVPVPEISRTYNGHLRVVKGVNQVFAASLLGYTSVPGFEKGPKRWRVFARSRAEALMFARAGALVIFKHGDLEEEFESYPEGIEHNVIDKTSNPPFVTTNLIPL